MIRLLKLFIGNSAKNYNQQCNKTWYDYSPEEVTKNDRVKLLWDFRIQTDHHLNHNRLHIVILEKASRVWQIIDVACPFHTRIAKKEQVREDQPLLGLKSGNTKDVELQKCICCCNWGGAVTKA